MSPMVIGGSGDPYDLARFVAAQEGRYAEVLKELRRGEKTGHWIWFIFPQIQGLGVSHNNRRYSLSSLEEAKAYLDHRVLGPRLIECSELVVAVEGRSIQDIFDGDDVKFRSSMTLFAHASPECPVFRKALVKYFEGEEDRLTLERI